MFENLSEEENRILSEMADKHGGAYPYRVAGQFVVVRRATSGDLDRYNDKLARSFAPQAKRGAAKDLPSYADAQRELAVASIVHPAEPDAKRELFRKQPAFSGIAASKAEELAGDAIEDLGGK